MRAAIVSFAIVLVCARVAAAETIRDIVIEGNTKTTSATVELIADIEVGDDWSADMLDKIKADLVSSGLFKDVGGFWEACGPTSTPKCDEPGVRVHLTVKDKHSWVIAPAFYNQPTNTGGGVGFGENNLFGLNQKLLLYAQVATGDSFFVGAWVNPSINGTRFYSQIDTFLKTSRVIEYAPPTGYTDNPKGVRQSRMNYLNAGVKLGVDLFHGLKLDARLRGAYVSYRDVSALTNDLTAITTDPGADILNPPEPGKQGWDVSNELSLTIDRRANWYGVETGQRWQASFEYSVPKLGSDFHYYIVNFSAYKAVQVLERHNLIMKAGVHVGHDLPFQQEFTMGGTSMRGYLNNQFRGDLNVTANLEYSLPLFTLFGLSVRGLGFFDSGYTTFRDATNPERTYLPGSARGDTTTLAPFKNSVGVGTRLYLRQIVLPLLGLDFGYGLEAGDVQVYLAIGLTD
ncbi:MAG TPA: BamA/TamA family outer membrane protein [Kofleriaceae bacterium]|nr:BamA/TamA family outer membrane protein [Kofleriaceae bacterium]